MRQQSELARAAKAGATPEELVTLLQACAMGDERAFQRLYEGQAPRLFGLALAMTRQRALAEDAVHDAFLEVWQRAGRFDPARGTVAGWLTGIVRFRTLDVMRRQRREETSDAIPEMADDSADALAAMMASQDASALGRCLGELEGKQREAILLAFMQGLTHVELAERLRAPLGTVKSWVRRGLLGLQRCLGA